MGNALVQRHLPKFLQIKTQPRRFRKEVLFDSSDSQYRAWYAWLRKEFNVTQVSIHNSSTEAKTIKLWGANQGRGISTPTASDVEDHILADTITTEGGIHPQGIIINPANGYSYVANQLSNNVSILNTEGQLISLVALEPSNFPGYNYPVALTANTNSSSPNFGKVYVVGSVANTVSIIDLNHQLSATLAVGSRPLAIAFNTVNQNLYVANLAENKVSVIDTVSETLIATLNVGQAPIAIGVNSVNGDVYVVNSGDNSLSVFDRNQVLINTINGIGNQPIAIAYHPLNEEMYVVATNSNEVFPIDALNYTVAAPIAVGTGPRSIVYNANNQFLYIGNRTDNTYTIIASDKSIRATLSLGVVNNSFAISQASNVLFSTNTFAGTIDIIAYASQSSSIRIDEDYHRKNQDFQHNPALLKHVKFILSSPQQFKMLKFQERSVNGSLRERSISSGNYQSPQNYLNVSEVYEVEGQIIDGSTTWIFDVAPLQTITILIYYRQFKMYQLL